jgi:hypothetical protein
MSAERSGAAPWAHLATLATAFVALFAWTWGRWPDALIDFGRELYVPWRMCEGDQLFTELAWLNGPLSPHWNALLFRLFGVGLETLVWANALVFAAVLALLHDVLRQAASPFAATIGCLVVIALCGFGQLVGVGNYNFICPYSHEATHGLLLGLAALAAAQRWRGRGPVVWVLASGLCVGLAFLTKPEVFVAALAGAAASLGAHCWSARFSLARTATAFTTGLLLPITASWLAMIGSLGSGGAWNATLGAWPMLIASDVAELRFYRSSLGLDEPGANLQAIGLWTLVTLGAVAPAAWLASRTRKPARERLARGAALLLTLGIASTLFLAERKLESARPWPLFALVSAVASLCLLRRHRGSARWAGAFGFSVFALAMLAKMALNARVNQYGFVLALPAAALVSVALLDWIPDELQRRGWSGATFRAGALGLLLGYCALHVSVSAHFRAFKREPIGSGADAFVGDGRARVVKAALEWIDGQRRPGAAPPTLAVFPEGVSLNYLARLRNPTPYVNFMPLEVLLYGEGAILESLRAHPPDVVLIAHKNTREYGVSWFGTGYATALGAWIGDNYEELRVFGDPPLRPGSVFGIAILLRKQDRAWAR